MFVLFVELEAKPGFAAELESVLRSLVSLAEQEAGIIFYAVHRPQESTNSFILYERYQDQAAWAAHLEYEPVKRELKRFDTLLASPPKVTFCDAIATTAIR